jgi:hypothetical protein
MIQFTQDEVRRYISIRVPSLPAKSTSGERRGPCPIHGGKSENFAIANNGAWFCHSKCGRGGDIFELEKSLTGADFKEAKAQVFEIVGRFEQRAHEANENSNGSAKTHSATKGKLGPIVATYDYVDEEGNLRFQVTRHSPKDFRQRRPDGAGGWIQNLNGIQPVLYRLPRLLKAETVFLVEGEKDVHALEGWGLTATCNPMGAGKWRAEYAHSLAGKRVIVLADNDEPGRKHALDVCASLHGKARSVRLVEIPGLPDKGDVTDWAAAGGDLEALWFLVNEVGVDFAPERHADPGPKDSPPKRAARPVVMDIREIMQIKTPKHELLIEKLLPTKGATLIVAAPKAGKTVLSVQMALAVASGRALLDVYNITSPGPALVLEQDDPAGPESVNGILAKSTLPDLESVPFFLVPRVAFSFGVEFLEWLESQIGVLGLRLVILDSYTALRPSRRSGGDVVKVEHGELALLDDLAKRTNCAIAIVHHGSKGSVAMDWSDQAAGSFAMTAATEAQIHISRFAELDGMAPERLIRVRGRHQPDMEMVLRFEVETLSFDRVMEGPASSLYPLLQQLKTHFRVQAFGPKELSQTTGVSRATAHRQIDRMYRADALGKAGFGSYVLKPL